MKWVRLTCALMAGCCFGSMAFNIMENLAHAIVLGCWAAIIQLAASEYLASRFK